VPLRLTARRVRRAGWRGRGRRREKAGLRSRGKPKVKAVRSERLRTAFLSSSGLIRFEQAGLPESGLPPSANGDSF